MSKRRITRFKVKKVFSSLLLSYGALLAVPFLIVFALIWFWESSTENYYKEIVNNSLTEGRMDFEKRLDILQTGAFSLLYDSELTWISYLNGLNPGDRNVYTLIKYNEKLNEVYADTSKYYDYCVVLQNEFIFRKRGMYVGTKFFYTNYRNYSGMTYEEWFEKSFGAYSWQLFPMQEIKTDGLTEEVMTYSYPIRRGFRQEGQAKGVVQFLLSKNDVQEMFSSLVEMQGEVYIFDKDGTKLARISGEETEEIGWKNLPANGSYEVLQLNGVEKLALRQDSYDGRLSFIAVLPTEIALVNLKQTKLAAYVALVLGVLFEIMLGIRFALRYSVPIRNVVENMQRMFAASEDARPLSEYEVLEEGVHTMQGILREKSAKEKTNFLDLLFRGEFHTDQQTKDEAERVGVDLSAPAHYVMVLKMERDEGKRISMCLDEGKFLFVKAYYLIDDQRVALLAAADGGQEECRGQLIRKMLRENGIQESYIGIGRSYEAKNEIFFSFRQACYCAEKAKRGGQREDSLEYNKAILELNIPWYPDKIEEKLLNYVRCGKTEAVKELFLLLRIENMKKVHLPQSMEKLLISDITATLLTLCDNMAENENVTELIERIEREGSLERAFDMLEGQFLILSEKLASTREKKAEEYYKRFKSYIEKKYSDAQLSMSMAAEEFGLSESYFSTLFKTVMGKAFSHYLESVRLEKSKELIFEGRYDMEQISKMVGYSSSATFRRAFKRAFGVAPSAWNKQR